MARATAPILDSTFSDMAIVLHDVRSLGQSGRHFDALVATADRLRDAGQRVAHQGDDGDLHVGLSLPCWAENEDARTGYRVRLAASRRRTYAGDSSCCPAGGTASESNLSQG